MDSLRNYFWKKFIGRRCYSCFTTGLKLLEQDILQNIVKSVDRPLRPKTLAVNNFLCLRGVYASGRQEQSQGKSLNL